MTAAGTLQAKNNVVLGSWQAGSGWLAKAF